MLLMHFFFFLSFWNLPEDADAERTPCEPVALDKRRRRQAQLRKEVVVAVAQDRLRLQTTQERLLGVEVALVVLRQRLVAPGRTRLAVLL